MVEILHYGILLTAHFFPALRPVTLCYQLETGYDWDIYTVEAGKHYKHGLYFSPGLLLLII